MNIQVEEDYRLSFLTTAKEDEKAIEIIGNKAKDVAAGKVLPYQLWQDLMKIIGVQT